MAKDKLTDYSATAASNTDIGGVSLAEGGMQVSDINNAFREQMSHLKDFASGTTGIDVLNLQDDDASASIKLQAPATVTTTTTFTMPDGDGTNGQFLKTDGSGALSFGSVTEFTLPSGLIFPFAGTTEPTGYLFCYGQAISRTTYADLFTAISTTYGTGDGSTTFNLPDLRGRVVAGQDDMGGSSANRLTDQTGGLNGDTLGATGGAETHTLTTDQIPAHQHSETNRNISFGTFQTGGSGSAANGQSLTNPQTGSTGGGQAHNNVQPTIILNYIIKT